MFYYLDNFQTALRWLLDRYTDLLSASETQFIHDFAGLTRSAQALLVRLIMRKGDLFRESRLEYPEIGDIGAAAAPLIALGWIDPDPALTLDEIFGLLTRPELAGIFRVCRSGTTKRAALETLRATCSDARAWAAWTQAQQPAGRNALADERVFRVAVAPLCTRLRILFFGNFRQDWSEFVLADLQIYKYEAVDSSVWSRAFNSREEIEQFYTLFEIRRQLYETTTRLQAPALKVAPTHTAVRASAAAASPAPAEALTPAQALAQVRSRIPEHPYANEWLESRRAKLLFQIAQQYEREQQPHEALTTYARSGYPGARLRSLRVMERSGEYQAALETAQAAALQPESEAERQQLPRLLGRIQRRLALPVVHGERPAAPERFEVSLPLPEPPQRVERALLAHLSRPEAPIYYVENTLINALFGLLCWEAIFAPMRGAFFHPFHSGPADLWSPTFHSRRQGLFERCLGQLEDDSYRERILQTFHAKQGIQSAFVHWGVISEALLHTALQCMPAPHLRRYFERLLRDLRQNRSGLPDLVQFWPQERRYRLIEVKAPGDRLQDNQRRWLAYCQSLALPVAVCHVRWTGVAA